MEDLVIAILAKDKAHCLPVYLKTIEDQTYPAKNIHIYIRTNNNNDNTREILENWISSTRVKNKYLSTYIDSSDVTIPVQKYGQHEWNSDRFRVLSKIRKDSVEYAEKLNAHYFVVDCDNFIKPNTLEELFRSKLPVVGPMLLMSGRDYSNYHNICETNGFFKDNPEYHNILNRKTIGVLEVDVIHCTYLIRREVLKHIIYNDNTDRYEYVIFSDNLRKKNIKQYLDNRSDYGILTFATSVEELSKDSRYLELVDQHNKDVEKILVVSPQAGMCNRFRALCSGLVLGKLINRKVYLEWPDEVNSKIKHIPNKFTYNDMFQENILKYNSKEFNIDCCYSEWLPGSYWYEFQSGSQRKYSVKKVDKIGLCADIVKNDLSNVILLETSHIVKLSKYSNEEWDKLMSNEYQKSFKVLNKYDNILSNFSNLEVGVSVRRDEFLKYHPEVDYNIDVLAKWLTSRLSSNLDSNILFSDDVEYKNKVKKILSLNRDFDRTSINMSIQEQGFIEFLILSKCSNIYGTRDSSFALEASKFGGKNYADLMS